ncbi:YmfQ family protein [Bradyrhizobium sp. 1]|uniref:YmfQ family protein n=1 Tax=Bradyrhizobium sp. 1 TaxID=241591 RepID=UPI001FF9367C|nr:YmfQ family protein [Bradyrhizobium sp. 1]MCK1393831.1 hypothetical protein [Bradyrhizobium sp. 1]
MNSLTPERLYGLMPALHRLRDAALAGDPATAGPLQALLAAFAREFATLEESVDQLYDDQFIETCAEWVTPYIGDLIGYRPLRGLGGELTSPRAEVADTIAFRRRKGTALMLEELAHDVTGWPAHAVEHFEQLATTQYMKHIRLYAPATCNLRNTAALFRRDGAFNSIAHTAEMRRPETGAGRYNVPNIGIFLWRLLSLSLTAVPLTPDAGDASGRKFRLNPLGADMQLFRFAQAETDISHLAEPINVPEPLSVRLMAMAVQTAQKTAQPDAQHDDDYGDGESLVFLKPGNQPPQVPTAKVRVCDLRDILDGSGNVIGWAHEAQVKAGTIGFDPERGRVLLGAAADGPLLATFHYGTARQIGGGEYPRIPPEGDIGNEQTVNAGGAWQAKLDLIRTGGRLIIGDSLTYKETPTFRVDDVLGNATPHHVVVAAHDQTRPLLAASGKITLDIGARGRLTLDGLVISGGTLQLADPADVELRELVLRDCTLVPGLTLKGNGSPMALPSPPSLIIKHRFAKVTLERCIVGPIQAVADAEVTLTDCIIDAGAPENVAFAADDAGGAGAELTVAQCTIIGKVHTKLLKLASNTIFHAKLDTKPANPWMAPVLVQRRQEGCVRFCYVPPGSITPRRFHCVPDDAAPSVLPLFTSLRYGDPGYAQLRRTTSLAIRAGGDNDSEIGVLNALFQPQREANLRLRLDEYLRFGLHAGLFFAS